MSSMLFACHSLIAMGAALLRRRPKGLLPAARQELLDPSKAWWGGRRGRLADRPRYSISVSPGVVPLVLPRRGSPSTHRSRGWLRSTRSFRTASAPTKLATRGIRTRAWMKQGCCVAPACTSELHPVADQVWRGARVGRRSGSHRRLSPCLRGTSRGTASMVPAPAPGDCTSGSVRTAPTVPGPADSPPASPAPVPTPSPRTGADGRAPTAAGRTP